MAGYISSPPRLRPIAPVEEVVITFSETDGGVTVEAVGVKGAGCLALTRPFEEALGLAGERQAKPEMHAAASAKATVSAGARSGS